MRYSILFTLLVVLSLFGCSNNNDNSAKLTSEERTVIQRLEEAGNAAVKYMDGMRKKDIQYIYKHGIIYQAAFKMLEKEFPERDPLKFKQEALKIAMENANTDPNWWLGWPKFLDGTTVEVVAYQEVDAVYSLEGEEFIELSKEAYHISLKFVFTKRSSAIVMNGIALKQYVVRVPVYYDGKRYLVDLNIKHLPAGDKLWL